MINWIKANDSAIDAATICSNALLYVISGDIKHRDITGDIWYSVGAAEDRTIENLSTATNVLGARSSIQSIRSRNHLYYTHIHLYIYIVPDRKSGFPWFKVPENIFLYKKSGIYCRHLWQKTPYYTALPYGYYNTNGCIIYRVLSKPNLHEGDGTCVLRHAYLPMIIPPARIQAGAHKALTFFFHARMGCSFAGGRLPCPWYSIWIVQFSATLGNFTFNAWKLHLLLMETSLFMRWCLEFRIGPCSIYSDLVYLDISGHPHALAMLWLRIGHVLPRNCCITICPCRPGQKTT